MGGPVRQFERFGGGIAFCIAKCISGRQLENVVCRCIESPIPSMTKGCAHGGEEGFRVLD